MPSKAAVVIPIYKEKLDDLEKISLAQVRKVLGNYPIVFVAPEGKNFPYMQAGDMLIQFHPQYFQNVETYSRLLTSPFFYEPFLAFDYILIYQLDAFVFYDALEYFCRLDYDYIGAAWSISWSGFKAPRVGNGGFSLRKVKACYNLLRKNFLPAKNLLEDAFFAICGASDELDFHIAPVEVADLFSMEHYPARCFKRLGNKLPFGCHAWTKFSADFYIKLFARLGYDLQPFRAQMQTKDYEFFLPRSLELVAMKRLIRDLDRKKSVLQYLPTDRFESVRVVKSPDAMKILARLLVEENSIADKIFIYSKELSRALIKDITRADLPHLILATDYDKPLIEALESKSVVSFQREYMKFQEKLFHNLGKR